MGAWYLMKDPLLLCNSRNYFVSHQEYNRWSAEESDCSGQFSLVAPAVASSLLLSVLGQSQLLQPPPCHLHNSRSPPSLRIFKYHSTMSSFLSQGELLLYVTLVTDSSGTPRRRAYNSRCSRPVRRSLIASNWGQ